MDVEMCLGCWRLNLVPAWRSWAAGQHHHAAAAALQAATSRLSALPHHSPHRSEAYATTGYSPVLAFNVPDLQDTLVRCLGLGATMDGAIQHTPRGAVAALRGPDGQMISLIEGAEDAAGGADE